MFQFYKYSEWLALSGQQEFNTWWYSLKFSHIWFLPFYVCNDSYRPYTLL